MNNKLRRVMILKYHRDEGEIEYRKIEDCEGTFHGWGFDFEEFETGPGTYSTAIIELDDGTVRNEPVEFIKFLDKGDGE